MKRFPVRKVAVLGAGVMGAQIAAHLVNVRVPVVLFDLPAKEGPKNGIVLRAISDDYTASWSVGISVERGVALYCNVEKTIAAAGIARVGAETINVGGSEPVTIEDYCRMAGEIAGVPWVDERWAADDQVRVAAAAWLVSDGSDLVVIDPFRNADDILHEPASAAAHRAGIEALCGE